jgi:hypothetical protein
MSNLNAFIIKRGTAARHATNAAPPHAMRHDTAPQYQIAVLALNSLLVSNCFMDAKRRHRHVPPVRGGNQSGQTGAPPKRNRTSGMPLVVRGAPRKRTSVK